MGSFIGPNGVADTELQMLILGELAGRRRSSVVSVNAMIGEVNARMPDCALSHERLAGIISEAAMLLGLVPVFDPSRRPDEYDLSGAIRGYGHRAHRPDPSVSYFFDPGPARTLPIQQGTRRRPAPGGLPPAAIKRIDGKRLGPDVQSAEPPLDREARGKSSPAWDARE